MTATTNASILTELQASGVLTITLNRPEALNAFDDEMSFALQDALKNAEKDKAVRCIVITGAGRGFCAGQDLKSRSISAKPVEPKSETETERLKQNNGVPTNLAEVEQVPHLGESIRKRYAPIIAKLRSMEKPIIAVVNGVAAGAGASIAFACDYRFAVQDAKFIQAFVKVGLIPDSGACWLLPRLIGYGRALELAMTGDAITPEQAYQWGLVNCVKDSPEEAMAAAQEMATRFAQGPTKALGLIKRAMNRAMNTDLDSYLDYEADLQEIAGRTTDYREGVTAFMEKRQAQFTGK